MWLVNLILYCILDNLSFTAVCNHNDAMGSYHQLGPQYSTDSVQDEEYCAIDTALMCNWLNGMHQAFPIIIFYKGGWKISAIKVSRSMQTRVPQKALKRTGSGCVNHKVRETKQKHVQHRVMGNGLLMSPHLRRALIISWEVWGGGDNLLYGNWNCKVFCNEPR